MRYLIARANLNSQPQFLRQATPPQHKPYAIAHVTLNLRHQSPQPAKSPQHQHSADLPWLQPARALPPFQPHALILNLLYDLTRLTTRPIHSSSRFPLH